MRYVFINPELLFRTVKGNMKLVSRGAMSREALAESLREIANKLEAREQIEQLELEVLSMDQVRERVREHVRQNKGKQVARRVIDHGII